MAACWRTAAWCRTFRWKLSCAMDADAVIAVELRLPPGNRTQLETLTGVLTRAVDVMITQNERRSLILANATVSIRYDRIRM